MAQWVESNNEQWVESNNTQWGIQYKNLAALIQGYAKKDLSADISAVSPIDLQAFITTSLFKGTKDLATSVFGYLPIDLPSFLYSIPPVDLPASLYGWQKSDLGAQVSVIYKANLGATLQPLRVIDLPSLISAIGPIDLPALLHGWDEKNLPTSTAGVYGPWDLQAAIIGTGGYKRLEAYIRSMLGVEIPSGLPATLVGTFSQNLPAVVQSITPTDLQAFINVTGQAVNLPATIIPKVIFMSQVLSVSLLEHKDMKAMINSACFSSGSKNLYAYIRSIEKLDLRGIIFGWNVDIYSNAKDLGMYISTEDYIVEDKAVPWFFADSEDLRHTRLKLTFNAVGVSHIVFDTLDVFYERPPWENLQAIIVGLFTSVNLGATVTAAFDFNFTELPYNVSPRTREVVIEFDDQWREKWRRFVEIFFNDGGNTPYHYFYVSGANRVYRVDRRRHWTVWAKGFDEVDSMIEHRNVRHKYIFKMSNYSNIDEAIRDIIDRASTYRRVNLSAQIYGELPDHANLNASIDGIDTGTPLLVLRNLEASAFGYPPVDLTASITGI